MEIAHPWHHSIINYSSPVKIRDLEVMTQLLSKYAKARKGNIIRKN